MKKTAEDILSDQLGAPSYWLRSNKVELFVTSEGGHLAPVNFKLKHRWVCPYSMPPWTPDAVASDLPPVLKTLRGDFFCLPFGQSKSSAFLHGETANCSWELIERTIRRISFSMNLSETEARVEKHLSLMPEQRAIYQEHIVEGLQGRYNYGMHAMLHMPDKKPHFINTSPFQFAQVKPEPFTDPVIGEYSSLKTGATFDRLSAVSLATGGVANLHEYPAREGFEDLVMITSVPAKLAWTAATFDGYIWISIKSPKTLPSTLMWFSNGGRHQQPWNGQHRARVGLAEVNSYFDGGLEASRKNPLIEKGISTCSKFNRKNATSIRVVQVVHPVPKNFGMITDIQALSHSNEIVVTDAQGEKISVPVNWRFIEGVDLE